MRVSIINKRIAFLALLFLAIFSLLLQTKAASQSDAIAVRVLPNINNESIDVWYSKQGFQGSPQSLIVDGYEAIRNGRTVFINAANLDEVNKKIYTNIYLISYNQESDDKTMDILGQLVSHWKFNNNINIPGTCSISTTNCLADSDCSSDSICSNKDNTLNKGKCILKETKSCVIDSDCPVNIFCDSLKARSIRDVKRLGSLNNIREALDSFKNKNNSYPKLDSGTYISGQTISVWSSWKETLFSQLGITPLYDPINSLGYCANFDSKTCWNNQTNKFVSDSLSLPQGSYAFVYKTVPNGVTYNLCSVFETKNLGYDTAQGSISKNNCSVSGAYGGDVYNSAPVLTDYSLTGETGREFNGYLKAKDAEGDLISWKLTSYNPEDSSHNESAHYNYWVSWASVPELKDAGNTNQKKVYAPSTGNPGVYDMYLTLTDSRGAVSVTKITITVGSNGKPVIEANDIDYFVDPLIPLSYTFYLTGNNSVPTYTITPLNSNPISLSIANYFKNSSKVTSVGLNKIKVDLSFSILTSVPIYENVSLPFRITALANGASSTKDINVNLKIEKPILDFQCENMARIGQAYPLNGNFCLLGKTKSGNHSLAYEAFVKADSSHIYVGNSDDNSLAYLYSNGVEVDNPTVIGVNVRVKNEYGASVRKNIKLNVNNFCGDGVIQKPNSEGMGGLYNDGNEICDGLAGVSEKISISPDVQYGCTTASNQPAPYPILDNKSCVFKDSDKGGGYCGDSVCQFNINGKNVENCWNCNQDCGTCLVSVTSNADQEQIAYLKGENIYNTMDPYSSPAFSNTLAQGKNIFGFWAHNLNDNKYGLAFKINIGPLSKDPKNPTLSFAQFDSASAGVKCAKDSRESSDYLLSQNYDPAAANRDANYSWVDEGYSKAASWISPKGIAGKKTFDNSPYIWAASVSPQKTASLCLLTIDYKPYNLDTCQPNCSGKTCGSDGCGGSCGACETDSTCFSNQACCKLDCSNIECGTDNCGGENCGSKCATDQTCTNNTCCPPNENVPAQIQVCVDNRHETYFNGSLVATGSDWQLIEKFDVISKPTKNVLAIKATDDGSLYGFSAVIDINSGKCGTNTTNTSDISGWKCTKTYSPGWEQPTFNDSNWPVAVGVGTLYDNNSKTYKTVATTTAAVGPVAGNTLPYKQIWASNALTEKQTVYCRYTYGRDSYLSACVPNCSGKTCGDDGCGGSCGICLKGRSCVEGNCACTPNCTNKMCGSDGCGDVCGSCYPEDQCINNKCVNKSGNTTKPLNEA